MQAKELKDKLRAFLKRAPRKSRRELERRLFELEAACRIAKEAYMVSDLEDCLNLLVERISGLMSVELVSIMLIDRETDELAIKAAKGLEEKIIRETKIRRGENIAGWILQNNRPLLIQDITRDTRFTGRKGAYYTHSLLSAPLKLGDKVIGVVNVNNKTSRAIFSKQDLSLLETTADLMGMAIANARLNREVERLNKLRYDVISDVSHELRTPLMAIKEAVGLMLDEITGSINKKQKRFLELAKHNIERLGRLVNESLELARLEGKKLPMKRKLFDIAKTAKTALGLFHPLAKEKGILLRDRVVNKRTEIWGDPDKLSQVLTNLIDNAIKYNKPRGRVEVTLEDRDREIKICVSDTGLGIPEEDLDNIFERFSRLKALANDKERKGWGLGLSITREIVRMHGGDIAVESRAGKGSKFIVTLLKDLRASRERRGNEQQKKDFSRR